VKRIPEFLIQRYTKQLKGISSAAKRAVAIALSQIEYESIYDLRMQILKILGPIYAASYEMSSAAAARFYDEVLEYLTDSSFAARTLTWNEEAFEKSVRAFLSKVIDGDLTRLLSLLQDRVDYESKQAAGETIKYNAGIDSRHVGWARVPTGSETCSFCIMLASRGAVYKSEKTAGGHGHYHSHCDCRIVPVLEGVEIEGYDPDYYYRLYRKNINKSDDLSA
jgi:hypothetical protein